jgi:HD-like signal output (HDOD) protein
VTNRNPPHSKRPDAGPAAGNARPSVFGALPTRMPAPGPTVSLRDPIDARVESKRRLLAKLSRVRPMSATAQRVLALTGTSDANVNVIADAIAGDPALATETLRIANSAVYRRAYPIEDLRRAVMTLGLDQLHAMATAMALLGTVSSDHPLFDELHAASVLGGTLAGLLTTELYEVEKSAAFIAGLLAEMGAMACLMVDDDYAALHRAANRDPSARERAELEAYGMTTWEVAGQLLAKNRVPEAIVQAVSQPTDLRGKEVPLLARLVVFSRSAAPTLLEAEKDGGIASVRERLEGYASLAELAIETDVLLSLCDWAISSASFMRGPSSS